jgi:hypothetical protein
MTRGRTLREFVKSERQVRTSALRARPHSQESHFQLPLLPHYFLPM